MGLGGLLYQISQSIDEAMGGRGEGMLEGWILSVLRADPGDKPANESRLGFFLRWRRHQGRFLDDRFRRRRGKKSVRRSRRLAARL